MSSVTSDESDAIHSTKLGLRSSIIVLNSSNRSGSTLLPKRLMSINVLFVSNIPIKYSAPSDDMTFSAKLRRLTAVLSTKAKDMDDIHSSSSSFRVRSIVVTWLLLASTSNMERTSSRNPRFIPPKLISVSVESSCPTLSINSVMYKSARGSKSERTSSTKPGSRSMLPARSKFTTDSLLSNVGIKYSTPSDVISLSDNQTCVIPVFSPRASDNEETSSSTIPQFRSERRSTCVLLAIAFHKSSLV